MIRAFGLVRKFGGLLAIELFVPGGTLIVLTILLTSRPGSPLVRRIRGLLPVLSRRLQPFASSLSSAGK